MRGGRIQPLPLLPQRVWDSGVFAASLHQLLGQDGRILDPPGLGGGFWGSSPSPQPQPQISGPDPGRGVAHRHRRRRVGRGRRRVVGFFEAKQRETANSSSAG